MCANEGNYLCVGDDTENGRGAGRSNQLARKGYVVEPSSERVSVDYKLRPVDICDSLRRDVSDCIVKAKESLKRLDIYDEVFIANAKKLEL